METGRLLKPRVSLLGGCVFLAACNILGFAFPGSSKPDAGSYAGGGASDDNEDHAEASNSGKSGRGCGPGGASNDSGSGAAMMGSDSGTGAAMMGSDSGTGAAMMGSDSGTGAAMMG